MTECAGVGIGMQTHSIAVTTKTSTILTSVETKPRVLYDLDRQPGKNQKLE